MFQMTAFSIALCDILLLFNPFGSKKPVKRMLKMLPKGCYNGVDLIHLSRLCMPTWQSHVKRCLSSGGLPRLPGYSKSKSRPSKPRSRRKSMEVSMNSFRLALVANMAVIGRVPKFHPPTASITFSSGFTFLMFTALSYLGNE